MAPRIFSKLFGRKRSNPRRNPPGVYEPEAIGISDSTCEVGGSPYNEWKLPIPPPEQRQLKPRTRPRNPQLQSPFFKLPPEIRDLIYIELLGNRRVHIDYSFRRPLPSRPRSQEQRRHTSWWQWWHQVCVRSDSFVQDRSRQSCRIDYMDEECLVYSDTEVYDFEWPTLPRETKIQIEWLRCCQIGYEEALPILYGTNVFATEYLNTPFHFSRLLSPHCASLVTSMDIVIEVRAFPNNPLDGPGNWANVYRAFFELFYHSFRNVRRLRLTLYLCPWEGSITDETLDAFLAPWETLVASREWSQIELCVPKYFGNFSTFWEDWYHLLREKRPEEQRRWTLRGTEWFPSPGPMIPISM